MEHDLFIAHSVFQSFGVRHTDVLDNNNKQI